MISFIIISYNRPFETINAVKSILKQEIEKYKIEIIIINNNSNTSYDSFKEYCRNDPNAINLVKYIDSETNLGVARGRNLGIKTAKGDTLIFLDDDAEFKDGNIISTTQTLFKQHSNRNLGIIAYNEYMVNKGKYSKSTKSKSLKKKDQFFTSYFIGCGHAISRKLISKIGYYRNESFYGMEEYDLSYRAIHSDFSIFFTSSVEVIHRKSQLGRLKKIESDRMLLTNKCIIAYRYLPFIFFSSHLVLWFLRLVLIHPLHIIGHFKEVIRLFSILKVTKKEPLSKKAIGYIRLVEGRLWY